MGNPSSSRSAKIENLSQDTPNRLFKMNASPGPCFRCGAPGHIRAACPSGGNKPPSTKNFKNSRTPVKVNLNLPYCDQTCSIHLGGIHLNSVCKLQITTPCQVHHGAHSQSSCEQVGLQQPQGLFPPGGYRPPNRNNPPNQTLVPNHVWNNSPALIPRNPDPPPSTQYADTAYDPGYSLHTWKLFTIGHALWDTWSLSESYSKPR